MRLLLRQITARELMELIHLYELEPWGPERGDIQVATVAATVANSNRGKNQRAMSPKDFMVDYDKLPAGVPVDQSVMLKQAQYLTGTLNASLEQRQKMKKYQARQT